MIYSRWLEFVFKSQCLRVYGGNLRYFELLFPPNSIIASFRRSKNLTELLAPSRYGPNTEREESVEVNGCFQCKRTRCDLCRNFLVQSNSFLSFQTGKSYRIRSKLSCDSKNIIYLASCKKCRLQYIGSTIYNN